MTLSTSPRRATSTAFGSSSRPARHAIENASAALLTSPCRTGRTVCGSPSRYKRFGVGVQMGGLPRRAASIAFGSSSRPARYAIENASAALLTVLN